MNQAAYTRRNDIDWLKIFATYLLFVFSAAKVFDSVPFYHTHNLDISRSMNFFVLFLSLWHLPLFFLLAGWSRKTSLQVKKGMESLKDRVLRLIVPLITGCVFICPLITYARLLAGHGSAGFPGGAQTDFSVAESFITFLKDFFTQGDMFSWAHLWFLAYLFLFTLLSWPFFIWLLRRKIMPLKIRGTSVYMPIIPLSFIQLALSEQWSGSGAIIYTWLNFLYFFAYFILGFVISRYSAYERAIHREYQRAGILGVSLLGMLALSLSELSMPLIRMAASAAGWCCVVWLLGFAKAYLEHETRWFAYLRESSLPVYILHPLPIVLFGYFLIDVVPAGAAVKFVVLLAVSFGSTMMVYDVFIRRIPVLRRLFGMKPDQAPKENWKDQASNRI
jgi:surface polysaccharide O-acyltransferase-like enzyme